LVTTVLLSRGLKVCTRTYLDPASMALQRFFATCVGDDSGFCGPSSCL
jgi:hypothetical protein